MIPESFLQDLLARVDIVDVVGRYVQLRKGGANLLGLCPFHNEKSPSFTVSPTKQFYHCFGCGAHGTAIKFLMEHTAASFPEAVRSLADSVGMVVPEEPRSPRQQAEFARKREEASRHTQVLEAALAHYQAQLRQAPAAIRYLKQRGLDGEIAARFGLGWTGSDRQNLAKVFPRYDEPALVEAGLVVESEDGRRYDRFRERVMFPIRNARGALIGFGGRIIGKGEPKYLNSPETPLFSKGSELYGLWEGRQAIRTEGHVIVVEGYMDVVGLAQLGIANAVATLGTATTPTHVQKLLRASDRVVFSFDGDKAGRRAAWRALEACLPLLRDDIAIRFLFLPDAHDPDSYVREFGAEAFRACVSEAAALSRFLLDELASRHRMDEAEGRAACVHEARPLIEAMPEGALRLQVQRELANLVRLTPEELAAMFAAAPPVRGHQGGAARASATPGVHADSDGGLVPAAADDFSYAYSEPVDADDYGVYIDQDSIPDYGADHGGYGSEPSGYASGSAKGGAGRFGQSRSRGDWKGRRGGRNDERSNQGAPPPAGRRPVASLPRRLIRLVLAHPALVDEMGDQQLEILDRGPNLGMVRALILLAKSSGARHLGGLAAAAEPDSELAEMLNSMGADLLSQEDLPDPQAEWEDALRRIELDALMAEQAELVRSGLPDTASREHYLELSRRIMVLKKGSMR